MEYPLNKMACVFWGDAWLSPKDPQHFVNVLENMANVDFFSFSSSRKSMASLPFVINQSLDFKSVVHDTMQQLISVNQLPPWTISHSWVTNLLCLQTAVNTLIQHQSHNNQQYDQVLLINHCVHMHQKFNFENHPSLDLLYADSLGMFGFNANWMLIDHSALIKLTNIFEKIKTTLANPQTAFFQPGDLLWAVWQMEGLKCGSIPVDITMPHYQLNSPCKIH